MEVELVKGVMNLIFGVTSREMAYIRNFTDNIEMLKQEAQRLKEMQRRVQQHIVTAKNNGERLLDGVESWVETAGTHLDTAEQVLQEENDAKKTCFNNLKHRHHYGKIALENKPLLVKHRKEGKIFESSVSDAAPKPRFSESHGRKNLDGVNTQKNALKEVIGAIKDDSIHIVGIYGAGGVGKTTLAVEAAATVEDQFEFIVFITVKENCDVERVKKEVEVAATRTRNGEKVLIILDDVWVKLDLDKLGIPDVNEYKSKILFTCRNVKVCEAMKAQSRTCVGSLLPEEAGILFRRVVGEKLENGKLGEIAEELVDECGGLPLLIQAVGNALKEAEIDVWIATRNRLKKHGTLNIDSEIKDAFMSLKLSYDLLSTENAKTCFLLCSMFPKGALIPLERLAHYMLALRMFNDADTVNTIEDARNSVLIAVDTLKSSFLLLNGNDKSTTKMHDIVHRVAHLIASEDKDKVLVNAGKGLTEWRPRNNESQSYKRISLMQNIICKLPDQEFSFPLLDAFFIQENHNLSIIPDKFCESLKEARVLDMEDCNLSSLHRH